MVEEAQLGVTDGSPGTRVGEDFGKKNKMLKMRLRAREGVGVGGEQRPLRSSGLFSA